MLGKRCTLCGGKLDANNVCTECGLDNNKSENNYKINQSDCDHRPLTHVHEEPVTDTRRKQSQKINSQYQKVNNKKKEQYTASPYVNAPAKKKKSGCLIIVIVMIIIVVVFSMLIGFLVNYHSDEITDSIWSGFESWDSDSDDYDYEDMDPYEYLEAELSAVGETAEYDLPSGNYIVGVHIPEGNYKAVTRYDFDAVQVDDYENGIYLYEYEGKDGKNYLDDLRLFNGAVVNISSETSVKLTTENAQPLTAASMVNPVTDTYEISDTKERKVGRDITPGVYDIKVMEGYGNIDITIYDENGEEYSYENLYMGDEMTDGTEFRNLVLPGNATIVCGEDIVITLAPSEVIESTDYMDFYLYY